ncbi:RNA polymerase sigma-70 factor [Echinicola salinicaeni]|uniref:RNA polymerase sigma-70 factor n=1 Tax=Echinicola salinicaeni TaxID=2762757 RepID=UPI001647BE12|nr:RNA polymerase sigma-70 factor [Echinicola salinicaeni]
MKSQSNHKDNELVDLLRQGELSAFNALYYRYASRVLGFAQTFIFEKEEAEEAVQEVFVKIWEKRSSLNSELSFKSYLFTAVKNQVYNKLRNAQNKVRMDDLEWSSLAADVKIQEELEYRELEQSTFDLIDQLPEIQKIAFKMNKLEGRSHKEIASILDISVRTVEHHVYLATKYIKGNLLQRASIVATFFVYMSL